MYVYTSWHSTGEREDSFRGETSIFNISLVALYVPMLWRLPLCTCTTSRSISRSPRSPNLMKPCSSKNHHCSMTSLTV